MHLGNWTMMLKFLHSLMASLVLALLFSGYLMTEFSDNNSVKWFLFEMHESVGVLLFLTLLIHIFIRIKYSYISTIKPNKNWQVYLRNSVHISLFALIIIMCLSGYLQRSPYGVSIFGISIPVIREQFEVAGTGFYTHIIVAKWGLLAIAIHLVGYFHHLLQQKTFHSRINHDQQI